LLFSKTLYVELYTSSTPKPEVALACGSASISKTFFSKTPNAEAKLTDVVVFPTPFLVCHSYYFTHFQDLRFKNTIFLMLTPITKDVILLNIC
jgi:hypothetical protein